MDPSGSLTSSPTRYAIELIAALARLGRITCPIDFDDRVFTAARRRTRGTRAMSWSVAAER